MAVIFVKTSGTLNPVDIVHRLCIDARTHPEQKRSRWVKRLTPITSMKKILGGGLEELARDVLRPHFHSGGPPRKVYTFSGLASKFRTLLLTGGALCSTLFDQPLETTRIARGTRSSNSLLVLLGVNIQWT